MNDADAEMNEAFMDEECHSMLDHGRAVLEEKLSQFGFRTIEEAVAYYKRRFSINFGHVSPNRLVEILMVAEKPQMAKEVARRLSLDGRWTISCDRSGHKVYNFQMVIAGRLANVWMVSTFGHLTQQSFRQDISDNESEMALHAKVRDVPCSGSVPNYFFAKLAEGSHAVILWLDNDHEGEAISFEVMDYLFNYVKTPPTGHPMDVFFRARFSSPSEAVDAMTRLDRPNFLRYLAMMAKHHLDLRVGVAFSKCQKFAAKSILNTYIWKLSFGPCSTVCVAIIVDHYLQTQKSPAKFCLEYTIDVDGKELFIRSDPMDENEAKERLESLQGFNHCEVLERSKHVMNVVEKAPPGLNTFELMWHQSKFCKRSPEDVAIIVQRLYEMGLITYPRSESTKYPADLKLHRHLMVSNKLGLTPDMRLDVIKALQRGIDKGDHPPIMPTDKPLSREDLDRLDPEYLEVYYYICRRFLASFMDDYEYSRQSVLFDMGGHKLLYEYLQHEKLGFTQSLPQYKAATPDDDLSVKLIPGSKFKCHVALKECPTPPLLKEYELIEKMEKYNVGTDGTLPNYFSVIKREGYVTLNPETRELEPSSMAISLIEAYQKCIPKIITPEYRAKFIEGIEEIAAGQRDFVTFYNETLQEINDHYQNFKEFIRKYIESEKEEFEESVKEHNQKQIEKDQASEVAAKERDKKFKVVSEEEFQK